MTARTESPDTPGANADAATMSGYDTQEKIRRLERDLETVSSLSRSQSAEIRVLRTRIAQLRASRWRKLGQKLGLAMTLDWERTARR
ncbi:MAG: hypothetical protein AAGB48_09505 [Planctomycetota bacterium]